MTASFMSAVSLATILALAVPGLASAGDLRLTFLNGRVTLVAQDVPLRKILAEWERVGGTSVVNRDAAPGVSVTLDLADVPETRALAILLQQAAGYFASERSDPEGRSSRFTRIVIMPGTERLTAGPPAAAGGQPFVMSPAEAPALPQVEQRIMPDGRVISVMAYPMQPAAAAVAPVAAQEEEIVQPPPVEGPAMIAAPLRPGMAPGVAPANPAGADPSADPPSRIQGTGAQVAFPTQATPTIPVTAAKPGTYIPGPKPEPMPYTPGGAAPPPPPIKPPDI